ncbi:MAG TPA: aminotransferase class I/II-fold pyridoxal phosphate-dependent enzyme, partial [Halomonas sp.]|nr:aminotransferase class I/II-fold pyridoxal phosphate-dependent enzyme [Halomonas sp.]
MNPRLDRLQPYPFEKLARLKEGATPPSGKSAITLSIGEPQDPPPHFIAEALISHLHGLAKYPKTKGMPQLRETIAAWLTTRFRLPAAAIDPER